MPSTDSQLAPTGARVLAEIRVARAAIEDLVASLDEAALTAPGPGGGWSIKDHLAHLTAWRRMVLGLLDGQPRHQGLGVSAVIYDQGFDAVNNELHARYKDQPWPQVLADFRQVYAALEQRLAAQSEAEWHAPYPINPPPAPSRLGNIESNTWEHDREHLPWMAER